MDALQGPGILSIRKKHVDGVSGSILQEYVAVEGMSKDLAVKARLDTALDRLLIIRSSKLDSHECADI